jgi:glycosyltransferase involved in cell wall biosynthesis
VGRLSRVPGDVVWWPEASRADQERVAVVTVSYDTRELTAFLLWSLRRILKWRRLEIVVVDNRSQDGSAQMLADAERGGVCVLVANQVNRQHGPALNQGISWLAARPGPPPAWIWILDSDAVVARPDSLSAALAAAAGGPAALVGEPHWDRWHQAEQFGLYSLILDPAQVWRTGIRPFTDGGDPAFGLLTSAAGLGLAATAFPFTAGGYVIHRGRGSLAAVFAAGNRSHPLYQWAAGHHEPHFGEVPGADRRYELLLRTFRAETGPLTGLSLASACRRRPGEVGFSQRD